MISDFENLIQNFALLPRVTKEPTYLEICKYPSNRFEEICSRLLCFYFSPLAEHGLGDLFLTSLIQILNVSDKINFNPNDIKVVSEDNAEGKRVDILIYSSQFVIGIENKVTASLYNPLDIYKNRIDKYSPNNRYYIVLSLRKIQNKNEKAWMKKNGFLNITYKNLFEAITPNIISREDDSNRKYIVYLKDFIKTLNNMTGENILSKELSDFFYENSDKVEELIKRYNEFQNIILNIQNQRITTIKNEMESETAHNWWVWEKYLLGAALVNRSGMKIGIEACYEEVKNDALGIFQIYIVTWSLNEWNFYDSALIDNFYTTEMKVNKSSQKCSMLLKTILASEEDTILPSLKKYFFDLKNLISKT